MAERIIERCANDPRILVRCPDPRLLRLAECGTDIAIGYVDMLNTMALTTLSAISFPCAGAFSGNAAIVSDYIPWNPQDPQSLTRRILQSDADGVSLGIVGVDTLDLLRCGGPIDMCQQEPQGTFFDLCNGNQVVFDPCARVYLGYNGGLFCYRVSNLSTPGGIHRGIVLRASLGLYQRRQFFADGWPDYEYVRIASCCSHLDENGECQFDYTNAWASEIHGNQPTFVHYPPVDPDAICNTPSLIPMRGILNIEIEIINPALSAPYTREKHDLVMDNPGWVRTSIDLEWYSGGATGVAICHGGPYCTVHSDLMDKHSVSLGCENTLNGGYARTTFVHDITGACPPWQPLSAPCTCFDGQEFPPGTPPQRTFVRIDDFPYLKLLFRSRDY